MKIRDAEAILECLRTDLAESKLNTRLAAHFIREYWHKMPFEDRLRIFLTVRGYFRESCPSYRAWRNQSQRPPYQQWRTEQEMLKTFGISDYEKLYAWPSWPVCPLGNFGSFRFWVETMLWCSRHLKDPVLR